jgi:hypothetical protein
LATESSGHHWRLGSGIVINTTIATTAQELAPPRGDLIVAAAAIIKQQSCSGKVLVENQKQQNEKNKNIYLHRDNNNCIG